MPSLPVMVTMCPSLPQLQTVKYDESLLVVLDAARFLPDNVALTQATISIVDDKVSLPRNPLGQSPTTSEL